MTGQDFHCGDGLNGLAQTHVVTDQRTAGAHGKQCAFGLIRIERRLQQSMQLWVSRATRKQPGEFLGPAVGIPASRDEIERVIVGAQLMSALRCQADEIVEFAQTVLRQEAVAVQIEQPGGHLPQFRRTIGSSAEMQATTTLVAQVEFGKRRLIASGERRFGAALLLQLSKHEFEMLAGPELVGAIVRT